MRKQENPKDDRAKVIHPSDLPSRAPVTFTAVVFLLLEYFHASDYAKGIVTCLLVAMWLVFLLNFGRQKWTRLHDMLGRPEERGDQK